MQGVPRVPQACPKPRPAAPRTSPLLPRSFKDWLHGHTLEAALKARCGCAASAAGLRRLLHDARQHGGHGGHPHAYPERPEAAARTAALEPGGEVTRRFLAPNPVVLQVGW